MSRNKGIIFGLGGFAIAIAALLLIAFPIQIKWGLYGVALTEIMLLLLAVVLTAAARLPFRQVFYFRKPKRFAGSISMYAGCYLLSITVSYIQMFVFPQSLQVNNALVDIMTSLPIGISFIIMAVMPAICEEALHRGFILTSLGGINRNWVKALIMGVIFGIFHLDPFRFLPTAVLGFSLSYIALKTGSLWTPILFHFVNNTVSVIASYMTIGAREVTAGQAAQIPAATMLGYTAVYFGLSLILMYIGWRKLNGRKPDSVSKLKRRFVKAVSVVMISVGFVVMMLSVAFSVADMLNEVYRIDMSAGAGSLMEDENFFQVVKSGEYYCEVYWENAEISAEVFNERGESLFLRKGYADYATQGGPVTLEAGEYTVKYMFKAVSDGARLRITIGK